MPLAAATPVTAVRARSAPADSPRMRRWLTWLLALAAAGFLVCDLGFQRLPMFPLLILGRNGLLAIGAILSGMAVAARWLPTRVSLLVLTLAVSLVVVFNVVGYRLGLKNQLLFGVPFQPHARYGHVGKPLAVGYHLLHPDYRVKYSFDEEGFRRTPTPSHPAGDVLMLGCSQTFGIGVNDEEPYPYLLATRYWPRLRVINRGFPGWGTPEAHLVLEDFLQGDAQLAAVCYGWIDHHLVRNWLRKSWHSAKIPWGGRLPYFELEQGQLVYHGLTDPQQAQAPESDATGQHEEAVSVALLQDMDRLCRRRGIPFFVLALTTRYPTPNHVIERAKDAGVSVVDLRAMREPFFAHDCHPVPAWHAEVARRLAADPRLAFLAAASSSAVAPALGAIPQNTGSPGP